MTKRKLRFDAIIFGEDVFCIDCLPEDFVISPKDHEPILLDYAPVCSGCYKSTGSIIMKRKIEIYRPPFSRVQYVERPGFWARLARWLRGWKCR